MQFRHKINIFNPMFINLNDPFYVHLFDIMSFTVDGDEKLINEENEDDEENENNGGRRLDSYQGREYGKNNRKMEKEEEEEEEVIFSLSMRLGKRKLQLHEKNHDDVMKIEQEDDEEEQHGGEESEREQEVFQEGEIPIKRAPRQSLSKIKKKISKSGYSGTHLRNEMIADIQGDELLVTAIKELGEFIYLSQSDDSMRFIYGFHINSSLNIHPTLTLTIIKGSLFTTLWSTIARYDDEYLLELKGMDDDDDTTLLWVLKGYIHQIEGVESSELDWNKMKQLQDLLQMNYVGIYTFAQIISQYVLCLPLHEREKHRFDPMPVTKMYIILCI